MRPFLRVLPRVDDRRGVGHRVADRARKRTGGADDGDADDDQDQGIFGGRSAGFVIQEITEELEEYDIKAAKASLSRFESPAKGVLADDSGDHELGQVIFPARFRTYP